MPFFLKSILAAALLIGSPVAFAYRSFLPPPQCVISPGGTFFCTQQQDMVKLARENAGTGYIAFVQLAYESPASKAGPSDEQEVVRTRFFHHRGFDPFAKPRDAEAVKKTSIDWAYAYCAAIDGRMVRYPALGTSEGPAKVERWACHSKVENRPQFGIEASNIVLNGLPPYVEITNYGNGQSVLDVWGTGKRFSVGEQTNLGMVIEVKRPLVKIQSESDGKVAEKWVREAELSDPPKPMTE